MPTQDTSTRIPPTNAHRTIHIPLRAQHRKHTIAWATQRHTYTYRKAVCGALYFRARRKIYKKRDNNQCPPIPSSHFTQCPQTRAKPSHAMQKPRRKIALPSYLFIYFLTLSFLFSNIYIWTFFAFARFNTLSSPAPSSTSASM